MKYLVPTGRYHIVGKELINVGTFETPRYELPKVPTYEIKSLPKPSDYCKWCRLTGATHPKAHLALKALHRGAGCEKHFQRHQKSLKKIASVSV